MSGSRPLSGERANSERRRLALGFVRQVSHARHLLTNRFWRPRSREAAELLAEPDRPGRILIQPGRGEQGDYHQTGTLQSRSAG